MALSEELPIYRDTYLLLDEVLSLTDVFPRFFRYSVGNRMVELNLDMLSLVYRANSGGDRVGAITEFIDRYRMLQMLLRLSVDRKVISPRRYAHVGLLLDRIGRQATGWLRHSSKPTVTADGEGS